MEIPPPLPPPVLPYASAAEPSRVLDYHARRPKVPSDDAGLMFVCGFAAAVLGLAVLAGLGEALRETWPSFGMILAAVPIGLIAFAFLSVAVTAFRGMRA